MHRLLNVPAGVLMWSHSALGVHEAASHRCGLSTSGGGPTLATSRVIAGGLIGSIVATALAQRAQRISATQSLVMPAGVERQARWKAREV